MDEGIICWFVWFLGLLMGGFLFVLVASPVRHDRFETLCSKNYSVEQCFYFEKHSPEEWKNF